MIPSYKQPLCDCADKGAHCLGRQPDRACVARDPWYKLPCAAGECPGWGHPDCCNKGGEISEAAEE